MTNEQQQSPKFCLDKLKKHLYNTIWGIKQLLTLTVRAAGCGLVGAGGVLGLYPRDSCYTLAAWALPSRFALLAHGSGFALTTIK
jgi:hypothetical protein